MTEPKGEGAIEEEAALNTLQQGADPNIGKVLDVLDALRFYEPGTDRLPEGLERDGTLALADIQAELASLRTAKERADEKVAELERYRAWMGEERPFIERNAELARQLHEARTAKEELEEKVGTYRQMWLDADAALKDYVEREADALAAKETAERERDEAREISAGWRRNLSHSEAERGRLETALAMIVQLEGSEAILAEGLKDIARTALSNQPSNQGDRG